MTLKARSSQALSALAVTVLAGAPLATLGAQQRTQDVTNVTRISVGIFRSADKTSGVQAADAIRTRLAEEYPIKQLYVLPKQDVVNVLESSGFPTNEALTPADARALAQQLRTDAYVVGTIQRDSGGYRVDANYVLTRDNSLVQPLPTIRVSKPDQAAGPVVKAFKDAHKQFADEKSCYTSARAGKLPEAIAAAKRGIAAYPNATLSRICLANALSESKASPDSVLAVVNEIRKIDPRSRPALVLASQIYKAKGDQDNYITALTELLAADPSNVRLQQQIANEFAAAKNPERGIPIIEKALEQNPGDPDLLKTMQLISFAAKNWKKGTAAGEELVKIDTAASDSSFFRRQSLAYAADSQPQKAAETAARGVAKYPNNAELLQIYVQSLTQSGQTQQAAQALQKLLATNPKVPGGYRQLAQIQGQMNQFDAALASLQQAVTNGDSASAVALYAVSVGQPIQKTAGAAKDTAGLRNAMRFFDFAVKTDPGSAEGKFLLGATALSLGQNILNASQGKKTCQPYKDAQELFTSAQINLPAGGKFNPQLTQQLLQGLGQLSNYADQAAKAYCK
jgi:tetratricopeptide (TPR) repeat protein